MGYQKENKIVKQIDFLRLALQLAEQNPEAEVHILADSDELLVGEYSWTSHQISKVELGFWYDGDDKIYTDPEDLADDLTMRNETDGLNEVSELEAVRLMKPSVLIWTEAGL